MRFSRRSRTRSIGLAIIGASIFFLYHQTYSSTRGTLPDVWEESAVHINEKDLNRIDSKKSVGNQDGVAHPQPEVTVVGKVFDDETLVQDRRLGFHEKPFLSKVMHKVYSADELQPWMERPRANPSNPGEYGKAYKIENPSEKESQLIKEGWDRHAFNQHVCEKISLHRYVGDRRDQECRIRAWGKPLPTTSVIIVFHNEAWCTLLRTVYSVLETSPKILLKEILLVDDASTQEHLHEKLEEYVKQLHIVRIIRMPHRSGLILARLAGAKASTADVLTFLDAHCECAIGWLEPLLERIAEDPTVVICPVIEVIDSDTFAMGFTSSKHVQVGILSWSLGFNWAPQKNRPASQSNDHPIQSPTMAGGLFSMRKSYFYFLGSYDEQMQVWGGENIEMSLRIWMCGGTLEIHPCSHVGHVFRKRAPYSHPGGGDVITRNNRRVADVWLDEYSEQYYRRVPRAKKVNAGDLFPRQKLREDLGCKSFSWYLGNIYPDLYAPPRSDILRVGEWVNEAKDSKYCMDSANPEGKAGFKTTLYPCHGMGGNQDYMITRQGEIRHNFVKELCLKPSGSSVITEPCVYPNGEVPSHQKWTYTDEQIRHVATGECMEAVEMEAALRPCMDIMSQRWQNRALKDAR